MQLKNLILMLDSWIEKNGSMDHVNLTQIILEESGYIAMWENDKSPTSASRIENIKELIGQISEFNSLNDFLEHISLVLEIENDETSDKVNIMTQHSAKGLEYDIVVIRGL